MDSDETFKEFTERRTEEVFAPGKDKAHVQSCTILKCFMYKICTANMVLKLNTCI